jgi:CHASE2 domain-containing sensor protein
MKTSSSLPLTASRIICILGFSLCVLVAVVLALTSFGLAIGWPQVLIEAAAKDALHKLAGVQPWLSIVLALAAGVVALAAHVFHMVHQLLNAVMRGETFIPENSRRLRRIGWTMVGMQVAGFITGMAGHAIASKFDIAGGFNLSISGFLAALLAFVLADVFDQASRMRDDLEGTV